MKEMVFLKGNTPLTTSLVIADGTQNQHGSIIRLINERKAHFERWGQIYFTDLKSGNKFMDNPDSDSRSLSSDGRGRPTKVALLNEQQATFLITLLRNNEIVLDFKSELVDRFYKMREVLLNQQNAQWQEIRGETKRGYKSLSDTVHKLYEQAVAQGCRVDEKHFYTNFARLLNKTLGIDPKSRDKLASWQLYEVDKLQFIAQTVIKGLLAQGADYHEPYKNCKAAFGSYAQLSYLNERLLESQRRLPA